MTAAGAATFLFQRQRVMDAIDVALLARVDEARAVVLGASNSKSPSTPQETPQPYRSARSAVQAVISRVLPDSDESTLGLVGDTPTFAPGISTTFQVSTVPGLVGAVVSETSTGRIFLGTISDSTSSYRYVAAPIRVAGSNDRAVFVAAIDINRRLTDLSNAFTAYWQIVAITFLIVASLAWYISGRLLRPLTDLRLTAARITSDNRSERIPTRGNDDLAVLGATVNGMLDRLDGAMTTQRQLLDDVRHELNTPIAIVSGHLELLDATSPSEVEETRTLALEELGRVGALVRDLAILAESEQLEPDRRVVDVAEFAREFYAKIRILPGHIWVLGPTNGGAAAFDREKIIQAWLQLVDNAAKYSPRGSEIAIGVSGTHEYVEFWVLNVGPKIPEEARGRIFERFGRIDSGRGSRGSGLGLAIVKAIAFAHNGGVTLSSSDEQTRFGIRVPRLAQAARPLGERDTP
jgi:two-component system OmpR family sensor kinase